MCVNCLSNAEAAVAQAALVAAIVREPAHRLAAQYGLVQAPSPVARDARTVAFLRSLDLEAEPVLGAAAVAAADAWVAAGQRRASSSRALASASTRPMRSQRTFAVP